MSILETIKIDQVEARKDRNTFLANVLTTLYSEVAIIGKNNGNRETTDAEAIQVIKKFVKNAQDVMKNSPDNSAAHEVAFKEIEIYNEFLPKQMTEDELRDEIKKFIELGSKNIGMIMGGLKTMYDGQYDGAMASKIAKELLGVWYGFKRIHKYTPWEYWKI